MKTLDQNKLLAFSRHAVAFYDGLDEGCERFSINTPLRQVHLLAQLSHESSDFTHLEENLNYSAERLLAVFPRYFKSVEHVARYAHKPEAIANRVYGGRMGNGDESTGDGFRYAGKGLIQLTGKDNYRAARDGLRRAVPAVPDFVLDPTPTCSLHWAPLIACWYFAERSHCNDFADRDDVRAVTRAINGGEMGLKERAEFLVKAKLAFGVPV